MKSIFVCILFFALSGCARDNYKVIEDGDGSEQNMKRDLWECKKKVLHEYYASRSDMNGGQIAGMIAGGVLGGAIGGAVFGAASFDSEDFNKRQKLDSNVEKCMLEKGYLGTNQ